MCMATTCYKEGTHKTSFTPPRFVEVPVLKQESERSCICVRGIDFASFYHFSNFIF